MFKSIVFLFATLLITESVMDCQEHILQQIYPNQNTCQLLRDIPKELQDLPYAIYPVSDEYDTARFNFNKRFNFFPHAIITPKNSSEVAHVLKIFRKKHLDFSVRSGAHCYEPGSLSSDYIIDLRNFNSIVPDLDHEEVYIGAGCHLGAVIETLGKLNYAIPTGTCPSVGVAGLALGGGIGMLVRSHGLMCDAIKSITLITDQSEIIEVDEKNHPDLFWALRGGGNGSFGIVLGFTFQMYRIPFVHSLTLEWDWDLQIVPQILQAWQQWVQTLPDLITTQLELEYLNGKATLLITGLKVGEESFKEWEQTFMDFHPRFRVYQETYLNSAKRWAEVSPMPFFKAKSNVLMHPLSNPAIQVVMTFFDRLMRDKPKYHVNFEIDALGGKVPKGDGAFYPRDAFAWWQQIIQWDQQDEEKKALTTIRNFSSEISRYVSKYCYANCVDYDLGEDYLEAYYGDHVDRLIQIKRKYDPTNLFHWKQSIPGASPHFSKTVSESEQSVDFTQ